MKGIIEPFLRLLGRRNFVLTRWSIFKALIQLAILKRVRPGRNLVSIKLGEYVINAPGYDLLSFLIKEKFIDQEYYFTANKPSPVIIDCGANIGVSLIYFKCLYPDAVVLCFEPYSAAFQFLQWNVLENKLVKVFLYNEALADHEGMVSLYIPESKGMINSSLANIDGSAGVQPVKAVKLSGFLQRIESVDLLKIDVEGAEQQIVRELHDNLILSSGKVKEFIIEYHYDGLKDPLRFDQFTQLFKNNGYTVSSKVLYPDNPDSDRLLKASLNNSRR